MKKIIIIAQLNETTLSCLSYCKTKMRDAAAALL